MDKLNSGYSLISRNLQEVIGEAELKIILNGDKPLEVYWGTATTGKPHVAYFVPIIKIADMLHAGVKVTILFADLHAYLDNMKSPWSILCHRATYYETIIKGMLEAVSVSLEQLHFIRGSEFELSKEYSQDVYRIMAETSIHDARKAGAEVVKQVSNPLVSGLLYPLLQALDEVYLKVDAQFGGVDQRKIFMLAEKILPRIGYRKRCHLMNSMVPGLTGGKMSASEVDSKIDMLESSAKMKAKLSRAVCPVGTGAADGNGVLAFMKFVIFPLVDLVSNDGVECADRTFRTYEEMESAFLVGEVSADVLRIAVFKYLDARMEVLRQKFTQPIFKTLLVDAYPSDAASTEHGSSESKSLTTKHDNEMANVLAKLKKTESTIKGKLTEASLSAVSRLLPDCSSTQLASVLKEKKYLRCLWSITPSGLPHLGHTIPLRILARLSCLPGVHVVLLIDDVAAFCEGRCDWGLRKDRCNFVQHLVVATFKAFGGNVAALTVIHGGDYKFEGVYMLDLYHVVGLVPELDAANASGLSVTSLNSADDPSQTTSSGAKDCLASLVMPCADMLDSYHLGADVRLANPDRQKLRKTFCERFMPIFDPKFRVPCFATHHTLPSLALNVAVNQEDGDAEAIALTTSSPMTAFFPASRDATLSRSVAAQAVGKAQADLCVPLVEPPPPGVPHPSLLPGLKRRLKQSFCQPGNIKLNPVLSIFKLCSMADLVPGTSVEINRPPQHGGPLTVGSCDELDSLFISEQLHPGDVKAAVEMSLTTGFQERLAAHLPSLVEVAISMDAAFPPTQKKVVVGKEKSSKGQKETTRGVETDKAGTDKGKSKPQPFDPNHLEILVGKIISCDAHPKSRDHIVCKVALGEKRVCTCVLGLIDLAATTQTLQGSLAVFLTNLKTSLVAGIESQVKIICVPVACGSKVVPLSVINRSMGDRICFEKGSKMLSKKVAKPVSAQASQQPVDPSSPTWKAFFQDLCLSDENDDHQDLIWKSWTLSL